MKNWITNKVDISSTCPRRIYTENSAYTVTSNYKFSKDGICFAGFEGLYYVTKRKAHEIKLKLQDVTWLEFSTLDGFRALRSLKNELRNNLYSEWFYKHNTEDNYDICWADFLRGNFEQIYEKKSSSYK